MKFKFVLLALFLMVAADAQVIPTPIGNLPQLSTLAGTELFPLQQSNGSPGAVNSSNIAYYVLAQMSASQITNLWSGCIPPATVLGSSGQCVIPGSGSGVGNVVTTGTPLSGHLTQFSGTASITNGDLSGDCTTSGSLVLACTEVGGVPFGDLATANAATPPALGGTTPAAGTFTSLVGTSGVFGSPTGGNEGPGTINAQAFYANGVLIAGGTNLVGVKTSSTTSANNTLTDDASLTLTFNQTGWYRVEAWLVFYEATSGAGGFQFTMFGDGTCTVANMSFNYSGFGTSGVAQGVAVTLRSSALFVPSVQISSSTPSWFLIKGVMQVSATGTAIIQWAQKTTVGANPTTLLPGSYVIATKIG